MRSNRLTIASIITAVAIAALAGCSAPAATPDEEQAAPSTAETPAATVEQADITVAESTIGEIAVDGEGMTVYFFAKDTAGADASACVDACATNWPAVSPSGADPVVDGVDGEVGTITGVNGEPQLTINGLPVYTFAKDLAAGDVNGQNFMEVWHVITPAGEPLTDAG